jgi:predicted Zn-dependent protease
MKRALLLAGGLAMAASLSCKVELTPENLGKAFHGIQEARKDLTPENEYYVGRSVATNILARSNYKYLDSDAFKSGQLAGLTAYVNAVGTVVAMASLDIHHSSDRPAPIAGWHFIVLDDATVNAFATPGGFVFITTGALQLAETEDELAAVLAHEVAHVRRGHALGSIKKSRWAGVAKEMLDSSVTLDQQALGNLTNVFEGAMDDMTDALIVKGYSRDTEFEADSVGLEVLVHAGYDGRAFVRYLKKLQSHQATGGGGFYATHPKASDRIAKLEAKVAKAPAVKVPEVRKKRFETAIAALAAE